MSSIKNVTFESRLRSLWHGFTFERSRNADPSEADGPTSLEVAIEENHRSIKVSGSSLDWRKSFDNEPDPIPADDDHISCSSSDEHFQVAASHCITDELDPQAALDHGGTVECESILSHDEIALMDDNGPPGTGRGPVFNGLPVPPAWPQPC